MEEPKKSNGVMWAIVIVVLALIAYGGVMYMNKEDASTQETGTTTSEETTNSETGVNVNVGTTVTSYKDGQYSATGNYNSPGGAEQIKVTLTLKDNVITDATVVSLATRPTSVKMQGQFISGFKAQVIGKKIDGLMLTKVSGSSLTPQGWNDAVNQIRVQAKA